MAEKRIQPKAASFEATTSKTAAAGVEKKSLAKRLKRRNKRRGLK